MKLDTIHALCALPMPMTPWQVFDIPEGILVSMGLTPLHREAWLYTISGSGQMTGTKLRTHPFRKIVAIRQGYVLLRTVGNAADHESLELFSLIGGIGGSAVHSLTVPGTAVGLTDSGFGIRVIRALANRWNIVRYVNPHRYYNELTVDMDSTRLVTASASCDDTICVSSGGPNNERPMFSMIDLSPGHALGSRIDLNSLPSLHLDIGITGMDRDVAYGCCCDSNANFAGVIINLTQPLKKMIIQASNSEEVVLAQRDLTQPVLVNIDLNDQPVLSTARAHYAKDGSINWAVMDLWSQIRNWDPVLSSVRTYLSDPVCWYQDGVLVIANSGDNKYLALVN